MIIILIIFIILPLAYLFISKDRCNRWYLTNWLWNNIGKPILNYKLRTTTYNKVVAYYFKTLIAINSGWSIAKIRIYARKEDWSALIDFGTFDWVTLVIDVLPTLVIIYFIRKNNHNPYLLSTITNNTEELKDKIGDVQKSVHNIENSLKNGGNANQKITLLLPLIELSIRKLNVENAYEYLKQIRTNIETDGILDYALLAEVDYLSGLCFMYTAKNDFLQFMRKANGEMTKANLYKERIVAAYVSALLKNDSIDEALQLSTGLKERYPHNIWAYIPSIYKDKNNLQTLPKDILDDVYFQAAVFHLEIPSVSQKVLTLSGDLIPATISIDNIPLWGLLISVYATKMMSEKFYFIGAKKISPTMETLYEILNVYTKRIMLTDVHDLFPEANYLFAYLSFMKSDKKNEQKFVKEFKDSSPSRQNKAIFTTLNFQMYMLRNDYENAFNVLEHLEDGLSICHLYFVLADLAYKFEYSQKAIEKAMKYNWIVPEVNSVWVLMCIRIYKGSLNGEFIKLQYANSYTQDLAKIAYNYYVNNKCDKELLKNLLINVNEDILFIGAEILGEIGDVENAIKLLKPLISPQLLTPSLSVYIRLLKKDLSYAPELYKILKQVRQQGKIEIMEFLQNEYELSIKCNDVDNTLKVVKIIYEKLPNNVAAFCNYMTALAQNKKYDVIGQLICKIDGFKLSEDIVSRLFNVLLVSGFDNKALQLLYDYTVSFPSQILKDLYMQAALNPALSKKVCMECDSIEFGCFVVYEEDGIKKEDEILKGSILDELVNHKVGDTLVINRFQTSVKIKIIEIHNKFFALAKKLHEDLAQNRNSRTFRMFTIDDLKSFDGNIFTGLRFYSNVDQRNEALKKWEEEYKEGEQSLIAMLSSSAGISEYYNKIFGQQKIYCAPVGLYSHCEELFSQSEFVLDLTSLILLVELTNRFSLIFNQKFIIPKGIELFIEQAISYERINMPSLIYQDVKDVIYGDKEKNFINKLTEVTEWIRENCLVKVVEEKLSLDKADDSGVTLEMESILLTMNSNKILLTEDWAFCRKFGPSTAISVEVFLHFFKLNNKFKISDFLGPCAKVRGRIAPCLTKYHAATVQVKR